MNKRKLLAVVGGVLAILVGLLRGIGGLTLVCAPETSMHLWIGLGLLLVASWLIITGLGYIVKRDSCWRLWLTAGLILFWIDGIINGFLLFGSPQFSGQIINLGCTVGICACLWLTSGRSERR